MGTSHEKGRILEYAVTRILESYHREKSTKPRPEVLIQPNQFITKQGVRHQIDVLLTFPSADGGRDSIHLIECKNLKGQVGAKEVYALIGKRDMLEADAATLIAHRFTSDATNLARVKGIELLPVADRYHTGFDSIQCFANTHQSLSTQLTIHFRYKQGHITITESDYARAICQQDGRLFRLDDYVNDLVVSQMASTSRRDGRLNLEGTHHRRIEFGEMFYPGEFTLNGDELLALTIQLLFSLEVTAGRLAGRFDMAQRGGFIRIVYPPGTFDVQNAAIEIITAPSPA